MWGACSSQRITWDTFWGIWRTSDAFQSVAASFIFFMLSQNASTCTQTQLDLTTLYPWWGFLQLKIRYNSNVSVPLFEVTKCPFQVLGDVDPIVKISNSNLLIDIDPIFNNEFTCHVFVDRYRSRLPYFQLIEITIFPFHVVWKILIPYSIPNIHHVLKISIP